VVDRRGPERHTGLEGDRQRVVGAGDLLDGDAQRGQVGATASVLLGERQTEQAELTHAEHDVDRERVLGVPALGVRRDFLGREVAHDSPKVLVRIVEFEIHRLPRSDAMACARARARAFPRPPFVV
jgi:hypothetical protein